jgi:hypothetical protein
MNNSDREFLKWLSIFHYVLGGIQAFTSIATVLYIIWSFNFLSTMNSDLYQYDPGQDTTLAMEPYKPYLFFMSLIVLLGFVYSICLIVSGNFLAKRKGYWFSFVVACIECVSIPLGTILGIITLIVLLKDSVRTLYRENNS